MYGDKVDWNEDDVEGLLSRLAPRTYRNELQDSRRPAPPISFLAYRGLQVSELVSSLVIFNFA